MAYFRRSLIYLFKCLLLQQLQLLLRKGTTEQIKYICPSEDETVCTCKSLPDCHPLAKLVKAKQFNELKNRQICGFDAFIAKYCCPTAKNFIASESSANIETASTLSITKTVTAESATKNENHKNAFKLGEPKSFIIHHAKIVPAFDKFIILTLINRLPSTSGHSNQTSKESGSSSKPIFPTKPGTSRELITASKTSNQQVITETSTSLRQRDAWKNCGKKLNERQDSSHVKGQITTINQHPWMAAIYDQFGFLFCGGTIASNKSIISAAHCFTEKTGIQMEKSKIQNFTIHLGNKKRGVDVFIDEVIIHPLYSYKAAYHDLAVVKLKKEIIFTHFDIHPICLPIDANEDTDKRSGKIGDVVGFADKLSEVQSGTLKITKMNIFNHQTCNNYLEEALNVAESCIRTAQRRHRNPEKSCPLFYIPHKVNGSIPNHFEKSVFCAQNTNQVEGTCPGDSGGPLLTFNENQRRFILTGVIHGALLDCTNIIPGIFVETDEYSNLNFLKKEALGSACDTRGTVNEKNDQCECKSSVIGEYCNQCQEGTWNLTLSNPSGCDDCTCNMKGSQDDNICSHDSSGQCRCKGLVEGYYCDSCIDGYWNLGSDAFLGCEPCKCNVEKTKKEVCDKGTGKCLCKEGYHGDDCQFECLYFEESCRKTSAKCVCKYEEYTSGCLRGDTQDDELGFHVHVTAAIIAIQQGTLSEVLTQLKKVSKINPIILTDETTVYTALDYAAYHGKIEIVKAISSNLLDINPHFKYSPIKYQTILDNVNNTSGFTPLHHAAGKGHFNIVQYFTNCLLDKNPTGDNGKTVMYWAAEKGQLEIISHYLDILPDGQKNPKVNTGLPVKYGRTPLHASAENGSLDIMQAINVYLFDINPADDLGITPLHLAAAFGHLEMVQYLVKKLEDINPSAKESLSGLSYVTPFHLATIKNNSNVVEYYLKILPVGNKNPGLNSDNSELKGRTPLHIAASDGYLEIVKAITSYLTDINPKQANGKTPLYFAAQEGHLNIVEYYLDKLSINDENLKLLNINHQNDDGGNPLHAAARVGHLEIVQIITKYLTDINPRNADGTTPLHLAASEGHLSIVDYFVSRLTNIFPKDARGLTPLHRAVILGQLAVVDYFVSRMDEINTANGTFDEGSTPLYFAIIGKHLDIVEYYLEKLPLNNKNPITDSSSGRSLLHEASFKGYLEGVQAITKYLTNINPGNANGLTPLHVAAIKGHLSIVEYFVENLNEINPAAGTLYSNWTPFHMAAQKGYLNVVEYYLGQLPMTNKNPGLNGSNVRLPGVTPLHLAASNGYLDIVQAITKYLTNINPGDANGSTPLHLAAREGHLSIVKYFVENLYDINPAAGALYLTPFHFAALNGHLNVVEYYLGQLPKTNKNPGLNGFDVRWQGTTPLHLAAGNGYLNIVQTITKYLTNANPENADGCTVLHYAVNNNQLPIVKYLVANLDENNPATCDFYQNKTVIGYGYSPLHIAAYKGYIDIVQFFVDRLEEVNPPTTDSRGSNWTPLHVASANDKLSVVKYLTEKVSNPSVKDKLGKTPYDLALKAGHTDVSEFLQQF